MKTFFETADVDANNSDFTSVKQEKILIIVRQLHFLQFFLFSSYNGLKLHQTNRCDSHYL
jgi:hypothetical protein